MRAAIILSDLVIADVAGVVARLTMRCDLRVLYMSGYAGDTIVRRERLDTGAGLLKNSFLPQSVGRSCGMRSDDLGGNAYVVKPVAFSEFVDAAKTFGGFWAVVNETPPSK